MPTRLIENLPDALASVKTRPLFVMRLNSRMQVIGPTSGYTRRVGAVSGGAFEGERLSGEVLDSGNDWQTVRGDSSVTLDVRLVPRSNDRQRNVLQNVQRRGELVDARRDVDHAPARVLHRVDRGLDRSAIVRQGREGAE